MQHCCFEFDRVVFLPKRNISSSTKSKFRKAHIKASTLFLRAEGQKMHSSRTPLFSHKIRGPHIFPSGSEGGYFCFYSLPLVPEPQIQWPPTILEVPYSPAQIHHPWHQQLPSSLTQAPFRLSSLFPASTRRSYLVPGMSTSSLAWVSLLPTWLTPPWRGSSPSLLPPESQRHLLPWCRPHGVWPHPNAAPLISAFSPDAGFSSGCEGGRKKKHYTQ